jgi:hypothetical protein
MTTPKKKTVTKKASTIDDKKQPCPEIRAIWAQINCEMIRTANHEEQIDEINTYVTWSGRLAVASILLAIVSIIITLTK